MLDGVGGSKIAGIAFGLMHMMYIATENKTCSSFTYRPAWLPDLNP